MFVHSMYEVRIDMATEKQVISTHNKGIRSAQRDVKFWQQQISVWERRLLYALTSSAYGNNSWKREAKQRECQANIEQYKKSLAGSEEILARREQELVDALAQLKRGQQ
jgi:hypothetical protein